MLVLLYCMIEEDQGFPMQQSIIANMTTIYYSCHRDKVITVNIDIALPFIIND